MDMTMSTDDAFSRQICAYSKATGALDRCMTVADHGRATHLEFNRDGSEVWVSIWDNEGEIVILDSVTLEERDRITGLHTPTGKFNVYNTAHDVY
jgi:nitrite reductase (NO-forming)/hydroxylamine reductase